jgi:adenine/guanine phosphoribosyltransferase-like PRPP-binding protein
MRQDGRSSVGGHALVGVKIEAPVRPTLHPLAPRAPRLADVAVASVLDRSRGDLVSPYDARYMTLRPSDLAPLIDRLVASVDRSGLDAVLAISEAGVVPAYAFAAAIDLPLVIATESETQLPHAIAFEAGREPMGGRPRSRRIYPLGTGDRVIVVEHHSVTGDSILNCVGALRAEGIDCRAAATVLAVDDESLFARLAAAGVELHAAALVPSAVTRLLYRSGEPPPA